MRHQDHALSKRLGIDLVQLGDEFGEEVVIGDRKMPLEGCPQPIEVILCEKSHGNYTVIGQNTHSSAQ